MSQNYQQVSVRSLLVGQAVSMAGQGLFLVVTAVYFTQVMGYTVSAIGLALSTAGGAGVMASFVFGRLSDLISPRTLTAAAMVGESIALLGVAASSTFGSFVFWSCAVAAMNRGGFSARNTLAARAFDGARRIQVRGQMRVAVNVGVAVESLAAACVVGIESGAVLRPAMIGAPVAPLVGAWFTLRFQESGSSAPGSASTKGRSPFADRRFLALTVINALGATQFSLAEVGVPLWTIEHTSAPSFAVGLVLVTNAFVVRHRAVPGTPDSRL